MVDVLLVLALWGIVLRGIIRTMSYQNYTKEEYLKGMKIIGIIGISMLLLGLTASDNVKNISFIEVLLPPIETGNVQWHWGSIILVIIVYNLIGYVDKMTDCKWIDQSWKKIIVVVILIYSSQSITSNTIDLVKGWQGGIHAVKLDREFLTMEYRYKREGTMMVTQIEGELLLENLGSNSIEIELFIKPTRDIQEVIDTMWIQISDEGSEKYRISPRQKEYIAFETEFRVSLSDLVPEGEEIGEGSGRTTLMEVLIQAGDEYVEFKMDPLYEDEF